MSTPIPDSIKQYWIDAINQASDSELSSATKTFPEFLQGFRPNHVNADVLKKRLQQNIQQSTHTEKVLAVLSQITLHRRFFLVLSEEAIETALPLFIDYFGREATLGSLLLDKRERLLRLAHKSIEEEKPQPTPNITSEKAAQQLNLFFGSFFDSVTAIKNQLPPSTQQPSTPRAPVSKPSTVVVDIEKVAEGSKLVKQLRRELKESQSINHALQASLTTLETQNQKLQTEINRLQALDSAFDTQVKQRVEDLVNKRLGRLTGAPAFLLDTHARHDKGLLSRVQTALKHQSERDERVGTVSSLQAEMHVLDQQLSRIEQALADALQPLPELLNVRQEVKDRLANLAHALKINQNSAPPDEFVIGMKSQLAKATHLEQLAQLRRQVQGQVDLGALSVQQAQYAFEAISDVAHRLYTQFENLDDAQHKQLLFTASPVDSLRRSLIKGKNARVWIDGHNYLHQMRAQLGSLFENGQPGQRAREYLINQLQDLATHHPQLEIDLWFDGPILAHRTVSDNLRVKFSGGTGSDRADTCIAQEVTFAQKHAPQIDTYVVSADRDVQQHAQDCFATAMSPMEWVLIL